MSTQIHYDLAASIGKVHLQVTDLPASLAFYQNVIGFQVLEQTDNKAMLTADGENVLLTIEQPDPVYPKQGRTTGLYHFAILLPSRKDLAKALIHLLGSDIRFKELPIISSVKQFIWQIRMATGLKSMQIALGNCGNIRTVFSLL
ncbi:VOC family protein [Paenibacillus larvae]